MILEKLTRGVVKGTRGFECVPNHGQREWEAQTARKTERVEEGGDSEEDRESGGGG